MNIVINHCLVRRNARIGQVTILAALVVMGVATYLAFRHVELFVYTLFLMMVSVLLTQVGLYFSNRWGRSPRPDQILDKSLKGLGREYSIYHYITPASHLLVGPAGIWVLLPYQSAGVVTWERGRYRQRGGGAIAAYLRLFGQDSLGRPDLEARSEISLTQRFLRQALNGMDVPVQAALVFYHPAARVDVQGAPFPVLLARDLKDFLRKQAKEKSLASATLEAVRSVLPEAEQKA